MTELEIDIESRSEEDIDNGVYVYADHPSTEILCVSWRLRGPGWKDLIDTWYPPISTRAGEPIPMLLEAALLDPTVKLVAHNAGFERIMLSRAPGRRILGAIAARLGDIMRWSCTAARVASRGLPRALDKVCSALGLSIQKDAEGKKLMLRMCKPLPANQQGKRGKWLDDTVSLRRLGAYCEVDVAAESLIADTIPELSPNELEYWRTTERINDRGIRFDPDLLPPISGLIDAALVAVNAEISAVTSKAVKTVTNHAALKEWINAQGVACESTDKAAVAMLLEDRTLPEHVAYVLDLRVAGGGVSSSKYRGIKQRLGPDSRIRGSLVFAGAEATSRWSSRGAQLQNLPRGGKVDALAAISDVMAGLSLPDLEAKHGPALVMASELLRPAFLAEPDCWIARGDYSQIEARVIAWLAGSERKLDAFRAYDTITGTDAKGKPMRAGPDIYRIGAAGIYRKAPEGIDDLERQVGKVSELALGFQGGPNALQNMAKVYKVKIPRHVPDTSLDFFDRPPAETGTDQWIVDQWRASNPEIAGKPNRDTGHPGGLWAKFEAAAIACMQGAVGQVHPVTERVSFVRTPQVLAMNLPSGRRMLYWSPRLALRMMPWGKEKLCISYMGIDPITKQWRRFDAYGGLFAQGCTQATARDVMADALMRLEQLGFNPVLTVHDEALNELLKFLYATARAAADAVEAVMRITPPWAAGLPVAADASAHERYVKG